jgi:predicted acyl esterase
VTGQRRRASAARGRAVAPRPLGPAATTASAVLSRRWSLPPRRNYVAVERSVRVPMSDGTVLLADHYMPITSQPSATVLVRCPYGRGAPFSLMDGALLAERALSAGVSDNRPVEQRPDVLVFSSEPLDEPVEIVGCVTAEVHLTRDNPHADLFARLCDVDPRGPSRNVCDGIIGLTGTDPLAGTVRVPLGAAAHRFGRGHRLGLQVAGGAYPRFARNPGNGQLDAPDADFVTTSCAIGLSAAEASALLLPVASQTTGTVTAHA